MARPATDVEMVKRFGFDAYVDIAFEQLDGEGKGFVREPHIGLSAKHVDGLFDYPGKLDMVVNVPPGTTKSRIWSILAPSYDWIKNPWRKFICSGASESLQLEFAEKSLHLMQSEWYRERWPHISILKGERAGAGFFTNSLGGSRFSTMMGGNPTGKHAHVLIFDDPIKVDDLEGDPDSVKAVLDEAWHRFINVFTMRRADAATLKRVCIMQRLHESDTAGRMLELLDTKPVHLMLPMLFEPERRCETIFGSDWRTEEGELLSPRRFPLEVVNLDRKEMTERAFAAQHQQRPAPAQGALFQRDWFEQRWTNEDLKAGMKWIISVDSSLKEGKDTDFCVIQVWASAGPAKCYLVDQVRARMSFGKQVDAVRAMKAKWPRVGQILIEDKANGTAIIDTLRRSIPGVIAVNPEGGKMARAQAVEPFLRAGNVWFAPHKWTEGLIEECISFPVGTHDDQVDCMTQALLWLSGRTRNAAFKKAMRNVRAGHVNLGRR